MGARNTGIAHHMWRIGIAQNTRNGIGRQSYECAWAWYVWLIVVGKQFYIALGGGNNDAHIAAIEVTSACCAACFTDSTTSISNLERGNPTSPT